MRVLKLKGQQFMNPKGFKTIASETNQGEVMTKVTPVACTICLKRWDVPTATKVQSDWLAEFRRFQISQRSLRCLKMRAGGMTITDIAIEEGISYERVRQLILTSIRRVEAGRATIPEQYYYVSQIKGEKI
jgi:DNA-binding CsgD family transcriptional regulator